MPIALDVMPALDAVAAGTAARDLESETLDFKTEGRSRDDTLVDLAQAAVCFANARGGSVVVGVADRPGGPGAFHGCNLDPALIRRRIFELTEPPLTVDLEQINHPQGTVVVVGVPIGSTVHAVKGRSTERIGTACMPMRSERIAAVVIDRSGDDWSAHPTDRPLSAVDPVAVAIARDFLASSPDPARRAFGRHSDIDLLKTLGVVTSQDNLTRAGEVLFTKQAHGREHFAYIYRRTPTGALVANEHLDGPMLSALQRVFDLVEARVDRTSVNVGGGQQVQIADLPEGAVREAIVNAVMHRNYRDTARITVEHAATRLAITSPGPFVSGVTVNNVLTTSSRSRNPQLSEAMRKLGLAETAGAGIDRMYAEMARVGHQPPIFDADDATVRVTLLGGAPNEYLARFVTTLPPGSGEDADTLVVLLTLLTRRTITAVQMAPVLQKAEVEAQAVLERLAANPLLLIEPTRESSRRARPTYRLREVPVAALGPAVTYRRRTADSSDRKILALVQEAGTINSRMVKILLDLDTSTTSRMLGDLVERGLLVKTSRSTRGPGVTYGPGPDLPKTTGLTSKTGSSAGTHDTESFQGAPFQREAPGDANRE